MINRLPRQAASGQAGRREEVGQEAGGGGRGGGRRAAWPAGRQPRASGEERPAVGVLGLPGGAGAGKRVPGDGAAGATGGAGRG